MKKIGLIAITLMLALPSFGQNTCNRRALKRVADNCYRDYAGTINTARINSQMSELIGPIRECIDQGVYHTTSIADRDWYFTRGVIVRCAR